MNDVAPAQAPERSLASKLSIGGCWAVIGLPIIPRICKGEQPQQSWHFGLQAQVYACRMGRNKNLLRGDLRVAEWRVILAFSASLLLKTF